jgi:hypothetical protein
MEIKVDQITNLFKVLGWAKLVQFTVLILIIGTTYALWENRSVVYNSIRVGARVETSESLIINLSDRSRILVDTASSRARYLIAGIQVVNVDFKKNSRSTAYISINDQSLKNAFNRFEENYFGPVPLFSEKESNNQKLINLINGEFVCEDFVGTYASTSLLGVSTVPTLCSISIPPYYGRFSGYMNIYLLKVPTVDEVILVRQIARDLSLKIYEIDVDKSIR